MKIEVIGKTTTEEDLKLKIINEVTFTKLIFNSAQIQKLVQKLASFRKILQNKNI